MIFNEGCFLVLGVDVVDPTRQLQFCPIFATLHPKSGSQRVVLEADVVNSTRQVRCVPDLVPLQPSLHSQS